MIHLLPRFLRRRNRRAPETPVAAREPQARAPHPPIAPPTPRADLCPCGDPLGRSPSLHYCSAVCESIWVRRLVYGDADWVKHVAGKEAARKAAVPPGQVAA